MSASVGQAGPSPMALRSTSPSASLQAALIAISEIEDCYELLSPNGAHATPAWSSSFLLRTADHHVWDSLVAALHLLVDQTNPSIVPNASWTIQEARRGHATCSPSPRINEKAAPAFPSREESTAALSVGALTHVFLFLERLAIVAGAAAETVQPPTEAHLNLSKAVEATSSASSVPTQKSPTEAQCLTEDMVESVLVYGNAVVSNVAATLSDSWLRQAHAAQSRGSLVTDASSSELRAAVSAVRRGVIMSTAQAALAQALWRCALSTTRLYQRNKRILHLLLSALSNVSVWPSLELDADTCRFLYQIVVPYYTSSSILAAWMALLCNMTAAYPAVSVPTLISLGAVADVQRLSLATSPSESATTRRLVLHALQLLSNISGYVFSEDEKERAAG